MLAFVLLGSLLAADLPVAELIDRLGSSDRVVRDEAVRTLEERADDALPALRAAREQADRPGRDRIVDLIARIEARTLDRPTLVALDLDDRPLDEAVATLAARSGFALKLVGPDLAEHRVSLRVAESIPFWEALDRLGRAGGVVHDPSQRRNAKGEVVDSATIHLVAGEPPGFRAYAGPLRLHPFAIHRHRDVNLRENRPAQAPPAPAVVTVEIQAFAEPGRFVAPNGEPRMEAVDDGGRPLAPPAPAIAANSPAQRAWQMPGELSLLHWHVPLGLPPDLPAGTPLKLRGVLPVVLASRRPGPLVIPLDEAVVGKAFPSGREVVRVEKSTPTGGGSISLILRFVEAEDAPTGPLRPSSGPNADRLADHLRFRMEFQDADGRPLAWSLPFNRANPAPNGGLHAQFQVFGPKPAARILIHRLNRLNSEIPFEFGGVPSP